MRILTTIGLLGMVLGCGVAKYAPDMEMVRSDKATDAPVAGESESTALGLPAEAAVVSPQIERKIIYTAKVELQVEQFDDVPKRVKSIVEQHDGFIANSELTGTPGRPRRGHWTARIPVSQYESFLSAARGLGEVLQVQTDSQDVSEEFYDVEARLNNKKQTEQRLLEHIEESTGKLKDTLDVEREIDRVRGEIDSMQGRLRFLANRTSLTTVELIVHEVTRFEPKEAVGFGTQVRRAWESSLAALAEAGQQLLLGLVFVGPWLVVIAVLGTVAVVCLRPVWRWVVRGRSS